MKARPAGRRRISHQRPRGGAPIHDKGQATVEFALVLPLLILIVLLLLQGFLLAMEAARVSSAAREAARAAAVGRDEAGVRAAAARGGALDPARVEVTVPPLPAPSGQPVTVSVRYRARWILPGVAAVGLSPPVLEGSATMLAE